MSLNSFKKMLIFGNAKTKELVDKLVADEAEVEKRLLSSVMEQHLLNSMLPQNGTARYWVESFLYVEGKGVRRTLEAAFGFNSAGINWCSVYDNFLPLVEFAKKQSIYADTYLSGEEMELHHCCSQLDSVVKKLEGLVAKETDPIKKNVCLDNAAWAKELLIELREKPQDIRLVNIYQLLLENWEELKGWTRTYRLLMDLVKLEKNWVDTSVTRYELLQILKDVSVEWKD